MVDRSAILVDVRCLQDPHYRARGIGRHARLLLHHARDGTPPGTRRLIGLTDPALPPLGAEDQALFDTLCASAYAGAQTRPAWFLQPSPMTHDPLATARLLQDPAIWSAAIVHDFIPRSDPGRYLPTPARRVAYALSLHWLGHFDRYLANSDGTAAELCRILAVPAADVTVTGVALDPAFEARSHPQTLAAAHVLVMGGGDLRKNVACAVRAHAGSAALQQAGIGLVVTGPQPDGTDPHAWHAEHGGDPRLLRVLDHVPGAELAALYRDSLCVVVASTAEGFSLPLIEAMALGVPAIGSDIAPHRALLPDPAWRFPPADHAALAALLERLLASPAERGSMRARQATIWPQFRAPAVAHRTWSALAEPAPASSPLAAAPRPGVLTRRRPRVAFLTPLPPARTGVADYSAATCAALGRLVDLHVFTGTTDAPRPPGAASLRPLSALPLLSAGFDRVVGVIGNAPFHTGILRLLVRFGGAAIAHDARMLGYYHGMLGPEGTRLLAERELGRTVRTEDIARWMVDEAELPTLFLGELATAATPLFVHSPASAALVRTQYGTPALALPFCAQRVFDAAALAPAAREAARDRLGVAPEQILVVTCGFVHSSKAPLVCIQALALLRAGGVPAALHFAGAAHMDLAGPRALAASLGLDGVVRFVDGFVDEALYRDHLVAADLGVQLRRFGFGSISGALMDAICAGLPTVANLDLAQALDAPDFVVRVPDTLDAAAVAAGWQALLARRPDRAARHAFVAGRTQTVYARALCEGLGLALPSAPAASAAGSSDVSAAA